MRSRALLTLLLTVVASFGVLLGSGTAVHADPSLSELEKQIDVAWNKLEPAIEEHNATKIKLSQQRKKVEAIQAKILPLQLKLDIAMDRVGEFATYMYTGGNTNAVTSLLMTGDPQVFTDQLIQLDQFARMQAESVQDAVAARQVLQDQKAPMDALLADLLEQEKAQAAKAKELDAAVDKLQAQVAKLYAGSAQLGSLRPAACPSTYPGGKAGIAVKFACAQIGKPYVWGADGPGSYDCSGLMLAAWGKAGVSLPHNAAAQRRTMPYVKYADLRPGDFVFMYSDIHHVGMYVGNGWIVHASRAGVPVRMKRLDTGDVHSYGRPSAA
ncbi:cell wall-associated NlpC family hydrolase [Allocatelliglobosispora scoriae]|uniref:Cell wall-associated NlpC family hydrolase n=1 Tax=Allocatelliglobosispora scoriae TaxID=643052 RepID=A0A841BWH7_9ACTN|nr:C40 family peptidase [Allocatelliglobosispora scoriae]MBB5871081.1 cell wall-associated NlpC family hydrolase [Allocatelliglobosispora scoriae]